MTILIDLEFPDLDAATDEDSYYYLRHNYDKLCRAVEREVIRGRTPEQISERFKRRTYNLRPEMAARLEQAARHMQKEREAAQ